MYFVAVHTNWLHTNDMTLYDSISWVGIINSTHHDAVLLTTLGLQMMLTLVRCPRRLQQLSVTCILSLSPPRSAAIWQVSGQLFFGMSVTPIRFALHDTYSGYVHMYDTRRASIILSILPMPFCVSFRMIVNFMILRSMQISQRRLFTCRRFEITFSFRGNYPQLSISDLRFW